MFENKNSGAKIDYSKIYEKSDHDVCRLDALLFNAFFNIFYDQPQSHLAGILEPAIALSHDIDSIGETFEEGDYLYVAEVKWRQHPIILFVGSLENMKHVIFTMNPFLHVKCLHYVFEHYRNHLRDHELKILMNAMQLANSFKTYREEDLKNHQV